MLETAAGCVEGPRPFGNTHHRLPKRRFSEETTAGVPVDFWGCSEEPDAVERRSFFSHFSSECSVQFSHLFGKSGPQLFPWGGLAYP